MVGVFLFQKIALKRISVDLIDDKSTSVQVMACIRQQAHYYDIIIGAMASQITSLTVVYSTVHWGQVKENIKAPRHWPLCGEFTGDRWIPHTNVQWRGNVFIWCRHHDYLNQYWPRFMFPCDITRQQYGKAELNKVTSHVSHSVSDHHRRHESLFNAFFAG